MNVIKAVSDNAASQRAELIGERAQLLHRVVQIGNDLAVLDSYELLANEQNGKDAEHQADEKKPPSAGDADEGRKRHD